MLVSYNFFHKYKKSCGIIFTAVTTFTTASDIANGIENFLDIMPIEKPLLIDDIGRNVAKYLPVISVFVAMISILYIAVSAARNNRTVTIPISLADTPSDSTQRFLDQIDRDLIAVDNELELVCSPDMRRSTDSGWKIDDVVLDFRDRRFQPSSAITENFDFDGENGDNFSLIDHSFNTSDAGNTIRLTLAKTRFSYIRGAFDSVIMDENQRHRLSSVDPSDNYVPNSLCLHFLAVTIDDGYILALHRDKNNPTPWDPDKISITAEEQLSSSDLEDAEPVKHWVLRTYCEELFSLTGNARKNFELIKDSVDLDKVRFWSLFFEENYCNYSITAYFPISLDIEGFRTKIKKLQFETGQEREGDWLYTTEDELKKLCYGKSARFTRINGSVNKWFRTDELHSSSRYRVMRYLAVRGLLNKK